MRILILSIILLLSGCYLANGPPSQYIYWISPHSTNAQQEDEGPSCDEKSQENLSETDKALLEEGRKNWEGLYERKQDYQYYSSLINELDKRYRACLYEHGYRFRPSLYWCLSPINTETCIENRKYMW